MHISSKTQVHSNKFIRLARSAKLSTNLSILQNFSYNKKYNENLPFHSKSILKKDFKTQYALLFLNQGLTSKEINKLRFNLKPLGINLTYLPTRFWSNSICIPGISNQFNKKITKIKKTFHGNMLCLYQDNSITNTNTNTNTNTKQMDDLSGIQSKNIISLSNEPLYLIYQTIENYLLNIMKKKNLVVLNKDIDFLTFNKYHDDTYLNLSRLCLPWDFISSQNVPDDLRFKNFINTNININNIEIKKNLQNLYSYLFNIWFSETDLTLSNKGSKLNLIHINLLLNHLKNFRLIYAGLINLNPIGINQNTYLLFNNLDLLNQPLFIKSCANDTFFCFEPFFFNCFNRQYLLYF
jgi:hypothetical protein